MAAITDSLLKKMSDEDLQAMVDENYEAMSDAGLRLVTGQQTFFERSVAATGRNMEIPGSIAGGLAGAGIGTAILPGVGTVLGGIAGAAIGAFGGSLGSDVYEERRLDFEEATKEAGISIGFDVATLGAGRLIRPIAKALGVNSADLLMTVSGAGRKSKPVPVLSELPTNVARGSRESLLMTQQMLEEGGGSLTAAQTGQAGFLRRTADELGEIGLFSGGTAQKRIVANDAVLRREVDSLVDGIDPSLTMNAAGVGEVVYGIVEQGRRAASQLYGEGLDQIVKEFGDKQLNLSVLRTLTKNFGNKYNNPLTGNDGLNAGVRRIIGDMREGVMSVRSGKLSDVIGLDKQISNQIDQFMPGGAMADSNAVRQLSQFRTEVREAIKTTIARRSKGAGRAYTALKDNYGASMGDLLPKINKNIIQKAGDQDYDALGNLLIKQTNVSKTKVMMKSIDKAFDDINLANAGKKASDEGFIITGVADAARAKALIKQSYLKNVFQDATEEVIDFKTFRSKAISLSKTEQLSKARAILGKDFGQYKRLLNAISDSTNTNSRGLFSLVMRSKEISALGATTSVVGTQIAGAGGLAAMGSMLPAVGILAIPMILAKIATNKAAVNRLLLLNTQVKKNPNMTADMISLGISKVLLALSDADIRSIQQEMR
jgi:hypothetical protein